MGAYLSKFSICSLSLVLVLLLGYLFIPSDYFWWVALIPVIAMFIATFLGVTRLSLQFFGPAYCNNRAAGKKVALTFDDGPDGSVTSDLLDLLAERNVKSAFFVVGYKLSAYAKILQRMDKEGHIIGNHTWHHSNFTNFMSDRKLQDEIKSTNEEIRRITGREPQFFRPPMGLSNNNVFKALFWTKMTCIGFSAGRFDQKAKSAEAIADRVLLNLRDGDIILLHDGGRADKSVLLDAVTKILDGLNERGYQVVSLEDLLGRKAYK